MSRQSASGHRPARPGATAADWSAAQYQPSSAPLLTCTRPGCGAKWTDDEPGRQAHIAVFAHSPRTSQPAQPPQEPHGEQR
jgi:hypothetical protein